MRFRNLAFVSGAVVVGLVSAGHAQEFMTKEQLQEFFSRRVVDTQTQDGIDATFHFEANGTFRAFFNRPKNPHWSPGTWWVSDIGAMCTKNDKDETLCHKYARKGNSFTRYSPKGAPIKGKWQPRL